MSIAPFLPQVPVPTATASEGGTPPGAPGGEPDAAAGFGDALAAALAGSVGLPIPPLTGEGPLVEVRGAPATSLETTGPGAGAHPTSPPPVEVRGALATDPPLVEVRGTLAPNPPLVEARGTLAPNPPLVEARGTLATNPPLVEARGAPATNPPLVEVRGAPATSLETTGPGAGNHPAASAELEQLAADRRTAPVSATQPPADAPTETPRAVAPAPSSIPSALLVPPTPQLRGAEGTVAKAVVQQVFPEVTRMVSTSGNGTHRITLTLQPAQLGEVRVTLVVRDGSVQVRLAGGDGDVAVQRALASGAPDLQRLLERSGAEARVMVRDLAGSATAGPPLPGQPAGAPGPGWSGSWSDGWSEGRSEGRGGDAPWGGSARGDGEQRDRGQTTRTEPGHAVAAARGATTNGHPIGEPIGDPIDDRSGRLDRTV